MIIYIFIYLRNKEGNKLILVFFKKFWQIVSMKFQPGIMGKVLTILSIRALSSAHAGSGCQKEHRDEPTQVIPHISEKERIFAQHFLHVLFNSFVPLIEINTEIIFTEALQNLGLHYDWECQKSSLLRKQLIECINFGAQTTAPPAAIRKCIINQYVSQMAELIKEKTDLPHPHFVRLALSRLRIVRAKTRTITHHVLAIALTKKYINNLIHTTLAIANTAIYWQKRQMNRTISNIFELAQPTPRKY